MGGESTTRCDRAVAALAERQHGCVARRQLLALGIGEDAIDHRIAAGRLHRIHHGVYAVGHAKLSVRGRWMAAVLAAGPGAVLSHRSAGALWGLRGGSGIEITSPQKCRRPGIIAHRATLRPDELTTRDGIPVTTVARTLLDLAAVLPRADVESAFHQAEYQHRTDVTSLDALVARYPTRRGIATIRRILEDARLTTGITKSQLEKAFLAFLDQHGLPRPHRNYLVLGKERDCVWPEHRLIAELDGWDTHGTRRSFEADRLNDRETILAGWRPLRITYRHIVRDGNRLERDLRALTA
jgi:predicted transcriptional regulator of viral defense system